MDNDSGGVQPPRTLFSLGRPGAKRDNGTEPEAAVEAAAPCPACGAALIPGAAFCGECGAALTESAPAEAGGGAPGAGGADQTGLRGAGAGAPPPTPRR